MDSTLLAGKKALIIGIANDRSIAFGCARVLKSVGAELAITYLNEKAKPFVDKIASELKPAVYCECDVTKEHDLGNLFLEIDKKWGQLDIVIHSIAYAPKQDLQRPVYECSKEGFLMAMDISCHSFIRMANLAKPLMKNGGSLFAMSFYGAEKVVENYNLMGPVKAALEASVRYMAVELGPHQIRVIALSPGPLKTRAASGLEKFDALIQHTKEKSPLKSLVDIDDVGAMVAFLASNYAKNITGDVIYIDSGYHIIG
ncbi:enoyl-ACP reductase FabI [Legionella longbeachae]|uniref:Enoyl-[acyl-carrier-protein] reductase [NADH] n=1 Tax=Legionella longbeachae serogroup 1 (strain NSW150) TaxID=661367 RepID=D3HP29_LEGLN|nr:enoyl-ACP reductase FabI [Legionella longbeachae]VEE01169.1 enoyl-ACP reductase [Legionella oakridgensis]HBD7398390.1 enoyl-ACP reductase FabI [Legionella pneumophila]ARB92457.1 enoyl-[acyl-carrier-protein] reductase FabI [Legionella longbeachae]ARM34363.1 enoyl-ACP reductase FabI [Legionella longbeachae]EEZ96355.1 enoyl-(acyl-carrier-protein) reductase [Legionella longbeachae D-4968]